MILSLICARKGSKRLPGKNLIKINNKSLLAHSINHAKSCKNIDEVIISTDCEKIAEEGKKCGAIIPFLRPESLSRDDTPEWKVWQHALQFYNQQKIYPSTLVILPTTAPLRRIEDIDAALKIYNSSLCDGVISVTESYRNPTFNMVKEDSQGFAKIAMPLEKKIYRTQDAELFYDITTVCYVMKPYFVSNNNYLFDGKIKLNHIPKENSVDIDTKLDLEWAKFLMNNLNNNLI
ncbi:acylneuraminate cytidylyltransferase family protein [bacterium]|nr:acylneuraminate cytidylyltransferase family protein [bacterium]